MTRKLFGLDLFDVVVHVVVTLTIAIGVSSAQPGPDGETAGFMIMAASLLLLSWRRKRALAARPSDAPADRVEELEARVQEMEQFQDRVLELEERLDFTERLLARQRELERLTEARDEPGPANL